MSSATDLLAELAARGIRLRAKDGRLRVWPVSALTKELLERLRAHKAELLARLTRDSTSETYADREIARFWRVAVPRPDGRGWYDPGSLRDAAGQAYLAYTLSPPSSPGGRIDEVADTLEELITELNALGVQLAVHGDRLRYRPAEKVPVNLVARMRTHKAELLELVATRKTANRLLKVVATWPMVWREEFEERAAIIECDANMPRPLAEDKAFQMILSAMLAEQSVDYVPGSIPTAVLLGVK